MDPNGTSSKRPVKLQVLYALIANLTCLAPSMSLGFSGIALPSLTDSNNPNALTTEQGSWMAGIAAIGTPLGCIISGLILDKFGRKNTLYAVNVCTFIGWSVIVLSSKLTEYQYLLLLIGRSLTGISTGMASMPATVYISEISVPKYRGMFTTWTTISFSVGVLVVVALGCIFKNDWGSIALIITFMPVIALFLAVTVLPESPVWLVNENRHEEAAMSMRKLCQIRTHHRSEQLIEEELIALRKTGKGAAGASASAAANALNFKSKLSLLRKPACLKPLLIMTTFFFFQQFAGTFGILFYAVDVVRNMQVHVDAFAITALTGVTRFFGCVCMTFFTNSYGRRTPSIASGGGMTVSMLALAAFLRFAERRERLDAVPIALFNAFFFVNALGFLSMPFAMAAELFPTQVRGIASGICVCFAYLFNFVIVKIYPDMLAAFDIHGVFCFYGVASLAGTIFVVLFLPETKGKTLREIEQYFSK